MAAVINEGARVLIRGIEHICYAGRLMPIIAGGDGTTEAPPRPTLRSVDEYESRQTEIRERVREIDAEFAGQALPDDTKREWNDLNQELERNGEVVEELRAREARIVALDGNPEATERASFQAPTPGAVRGNDIFDLSTIRGSVSNPREAGQELRDRAARLVEMATPQHPEIDAGRAKSYAEGLLSRDSEDGKLARYFLSVGSPTYMRAFGKALAGAERSREEQASLEFAQMAQRALSLTGAAGGFAVPFSLDPTILISSNGVINPIRQIARVETITVDEWRGITSTGITSSYAAEATETTDNAPTLVQPTVSTEKAQAFVPFSIEVGQDWNGLQDQMARLLQESKDILESAKFITGTGTNEPFGVAVGTTNTVNAAAGQTFTLANLYSLIAALPPRYRANGTFIGDLLILNLIRQFETTGGSQSGVWVETLQPDVPARLLGKAVYEASDMPDTPATAAKFLIFGDFSRYLIVDRVGLSVEVIPHIFGANQRPTGQRGLYAYWRNGAKVLDANAFRSLLGVA